jgi:capsular polysaccharide transport system permease protein
VHEDLLGGGGMRTRFEMHGRIIWALLLRELSTRYGRDNLGFLWVICEPLVFAGAVTVMWTSIKPPYEHGIKLIPFLVTGYMSLILLRHMIGHGVNCVRVNQSLLYHRNITTLHLFIGRLALEFIGVTLAFFTIFVFMLMIGQMEPPKDLVMVYVGWAILAWMGAGLAMILGALSQMIEFIERIVQVFTYMLVPMSGTFFMAAWVPAGFRNALLTLPFIHSVEMVRHGFFGEFVTTYYDVGYAAAWAAGFTLVGLFLVQFVRNRLEIE